jgi:hypothetical protein
MSVAVKSAVHQANAKGGNFTGGRWSRLECRGVAGGVDVSGLQNNKRFVTLNLLSSFPQNQLEEFMHTFLESPLEVHPRSSAQVK